MALVWQKNVDGKRYEVRSAGQTRRLYTDGVFHSQYNPSAPVTGSVWDLLMLPAFFYPRGVIKRVLVLGVGGGTVLRQLNHFLQPEQIIGIELNPVHLQVARKHFKVEGPNVQLVEGDGGEWLYHYRDEPFDMIIDDLFGEDEGEPQRAVAADSDWVSTLFANLGKQGVITANFASGNELRQSAFVSRAKIARRFNSAFQLTTPYNENAVGAFLRIPATGQQLRDHLRQVPGLNPDRKTCRLRYSLRRI